MLEYRIVQKTVGSHVALQWNSFLGLKHNKTELVKFLVPEWEKKNITEKVIYVTSCEKCVCLNDNQGVPALYCRKKLTPELFYIQSILLIATGMLSTHLTLMLLFLL